MPLNLKQTLILCSVILSSLSGCGGGGSDSTPPSDPIDRTAPVISIAGDRTVNHEQGSVYTDPGATATDAVDGSVLVTTSGAVGSDAGTYTLTYRATDAAANAATATRTVVVADTISPVMTLVGADAIDHEQGAPFTDPGVSASDVVDGTVAVTTNSTVGTAVGSYELIYTATDMAGNTTTASRMVTVIAPATVGDATDLMVLDGGSVDAAWDRGINAFDEAIGFSECNNDGGAGCPSISWQFVDDAVRGDVLEITHSATGNLAGLFIAASVPLNVSGFATGDLQFDVRVISGDSNITMKLDCVLSMLVR